MRINSPTYLSFLVLLLFQDVAEKRIPIMLCANKVDLRLEACAAGRKCVSTEEGEKTARDHSAIFIETSAKAGFNVKVLFRKIAAALPGMEVKDAEGEGEDLIEVNLSSTRAESKSSSTCC